MNARTDCQGSSSRSLANSRSKWTRHALLGAVQAVVRRVEVADQRPGERFPQDPDQDIATAMAVDEEQGQAGVAEAPGPAGPAVDPPAGLVPLDHGGLAEQLPEFIDHRGEQLAAPAQVTEQAGAADGQSEEVVEQVAGLAQGDAEVGAAVAGEQAGARADVRTGQFQVAAALAGPLAAPAAVDVPPIAMPLELRLGDVRHEVVLELAGGFEVARAAMGALLGTDIVFDEGGAGRGLGPKAAGVLTMSLAAAVGSRAVGLVAAPRGALAALMDGLQLVLDLRQPAAQVGVLRLQVGDPLLQGGDVGQDGGLSLGRDRIPERCGDRRSCSHTPTTMRRYRRFGLGAAVGSRIAGMDKRTA